MAQNIGFGVKSASSCGKGGIMVILIGGASHTGKTLLAQRMIERYHFPCLSIDLVKMGLIRSGVTSLTPIDDARLKPYLWNIVKEIVKTAVENGQNLIVEGAYIPCDWQNYFNQKYRRDIRAYFLIMSANYIKRHWAEIVSHACDIEYRRSDDFSVYNAVSENTENLALCKKHGANIIFIDGKYNVHVPEIK